MSAPVTKGARVSGIPSNGGIPVYVRTRIDIARSVPDAFVAIMQDVHTRPSGDDPCEWTFTYNAIEYTLTARDAR